MKQASKQHRNNRNKGGRRSGGGGGGGHSTNRVYDSSGPEGKVRGTAQQIIDKYTSLARDAMLAGDRIIAENFYQHAEHYQRILLAIQTAEAEERERRQAAQQAQQERRNAESQADGGDRTDSNPRSAVEEQPGQGSDQPSPRGQDAAQKEALPSPGSEGESGPELVKTPEQLKAEERDGSQDRKPRQTRSKTANGADEPEPAAGDAENEAEASPKPRRGRPKKTPPPEEAEVPS